MRHARGGGGEQPHPRGLSVLFFTEMWERFSFYGMRALLVLYMTRDRSMSEASAARTYGWYTASIFAACAVGGYLADRVVACGRLIVIGASLMLVGHALMSFDRAATFYGGLVLISAGCGAFKPNVTTVLGRLYEVHDRRRANGFIIYYVGIGLGALMAPVACGFLATRFGYRWAFGAAAIGMAFALATLWTGWSALTPSAPAGPTHGQPARAFPREWIPKVLVLCAFSALFWVTSEQAATSVTLFAEHDVDRRISLGPFGARTVPAESLIALNPLFVLVGAPFVTRIFALAERRGLRLTTPHRIVIGLGLVASSFVPLIAAAVGATGGRVSMGWMVAFYALASFGELCVLPSGMSLITAIVPDDRVGLAMSAWFASGFVGNLGAGELASLWPRMAHAPFFALCLIIMVSGTFVLARLSTALFGKRTSRIADLAGDPTKRAGIA